MPFTGGQRWYTQILFAGKTRRNLPPVDDLPGIFCDATDNHWQSTTSLYDFVAWMDTQVNAETPGSHLSTNGLNHTLEK
eukprot:5135586-Amphidinium_carterae.1